MAKYLFCLFITMAMWAQVCAEPLLLVTLESPPAEFSLNGKSYGRNVDIAREGLRRMGFDTRVRILPWKRALRMVETGGADAIIDAAYTPERTTYLFYPDEEIYIEEWYLFKRGGSPITIDRDLGNAGHFSLGICRGFEYGGLIQAAIDRNRFKMTQVAVNNEANVRKLLARRLDLLVGVKLTILHLARKMGYANKVEMVPMTETGRPYLLSASKTYLAFSRKTVSEETVHRFSIVLRQMKGDGTIGEIEKKYP